MRRKWKWLVLFIMVASLGVYMIGGFLGRSVPVDVIGKLPDKDVADIVALVKREFRKEILPNFSWPSIRNLPAAYRHYANIKLFTIVATNNDSTALVFVWYNTNAIKRVEPQPDYWTGEPRTAIYMHMQALFGTNSTELTVGKGSNGWRFGTLWFD